MREANVSRPAPSGILAGLKRLAIRASLNVRASVGSAAQSLANACAAQPGTEGTCRGQVAESFGDLPVYRGIFKHREVGRLFGIQDPFYRCHEERRGTQTWIGGR